MTDLERLRDDDGELGAAFRSAENDAPKAGATAALLTALSLGAVGAVGAASATATATAATATTTATSVGAAGSGAAGAAIKTSTFAAAWKLFAVSAVVVSGAVASVHVATRDLAAPSTTPSGTVLMASSAKPAAAPRGGAVAPKPIEALEAIPEPSATPALADPVVGSPMVAEPSPLAMRAQEPAAPREDSNGMGHTATPQLRVSPPSAAETSALGATEAPAPKASAASIVPAASAAAIPKDEPPRALPNTHSNTRVADEVSALDGARSLLSSGRPAEALSALAAYEKAFPRPVLGEEALALKVEALVRAGRLPEAASLGNAFLERSPSSPVASRVRRSLAAAKK